MSEEIIKSSPATALDTAAPDMERCCAACACDCRSNLESTNWLDDVPDNDLDIVEVHFKNTRRGFYRNSIHVPLKKGDWVAVEANPGHDIGQVALTGRLVKLQMRRVNLRPDAEILRIFRKAKPVDMERFNQAKAREEDTMIRSRKIAADLGLKMKIGDVEYQGDGNKAIFYYIADERVDFRQLIKVLADVFKIRVEMKQIGARQEAGRIGGIGPCGRPMCCATWMCNFVSVATSAARFQDISLNPQNLAGQCAKLKCCINFEVDSYVEASKQMPPRDVKLETKDAIYYQFKTDILKREATYSTEKNSPANLVTLSAGRVFEVMALNRNGVKPEKLTLDDDEAKRELAFGDILNQDSIDKKKKKSKSKSKSQETKPDASRESKRSGKPRRDAGDQTASQEALADNAQHRQRRRHRPAQPGGAERRGPRRQASNDGSGKKIPKGGDDKQ